MFETGGAGFRDLALANAAGAAGDTLVAIGLADTLFFGVPSAQARGNVALYLLLTAAPFAVIGPTLGAILGRQPLAYRLSLVASALLRATAVVLLVGLFDTLWLFPLGFVLLVLSRIHTISRNALLPVALDEPRELVAANARLAWIGVLGGAIAALIGVGLTALTGPAGPLIGAVAAFAATTLAAVRLPEPVPTAKPRHRGRRAHLPRSVRLAQIATAGVRLVNGFLLLLLAFAFRDRGVPLLDVGAVLAAAGAGFGLASVLSPALARRLREEPTVVAALALEAAAAFVAAQWFGLPAAAVLAAAAGFAWGTAKLAFDGLLQATVPAVRRGAAFTRSETLFALAWVLGAVVPTVTPLPVRLGLSLAGLAALGAQVLYAVRLIDPPRAASDPTRVSRPHPRRCRRRGGPAGPPPPSRRGPR